MTTAETYVALLHHPMRDRTGGVVTTALTTLDLHDMARTCRSFGVARFYIVHPLEPQRAIAERILRHWQGDAARHDHRGAALGRVRVVVGLEDAVADVAQAAGQAPRVVATTARRIDRAISIPALRGLAGPTLIVFGTGFGMVDSLLERADEVLLPVQSASDYNHLSVRSACAILLDRLHGDRED